MIKVRNDGAINVLGVKFQGVKDIIAHALSGEPKNGVYVAADRSFYPCFDSSDVLYEDRWYWNFVFAKSAEELERKLERLDELPGPLCYDKLTEELHPMAYWEGDSFFPVKLTDGKEQRITPRFVDKLEANEIFVFGSHCSGSHGEGAAAYAREHFGAVKGQAEGLQGQSYAIPTAGVNLESIRRSVGRFLEFAREHGELKFLVTPVGCGKAGWSHRHIVPLFRGAMEMTNVWLPWPFLNYLLIFDE